MIIFNLFFSYAVLEEIFKQNKKRKKVEQDKFQVVFWFVYLLMALAYLFDDFVVIFLRTKKKNIVFQKIHTFLDIFM